MATNEEEKKGRLDKAMAYVQSTRDNLFTANTMRRAFDPKNLSKEVLLRGLRSVLNTKIATGVLGVFTLSLLAYDLFSGAQIAQNIFDYFATGTEVVAEASKLGSSVVAIVGGAATLGMGFVVASIGLELFNGVNKFLSARREYNDAAKNGSEAEVEIAEVQYKAAKKVVYAQSAATLVSIAVGAFIFAPALIGVAGVTAALGVTGTALVGLAVGAITMLSTLLYTSRTKRIAAETVNELEQNIHQDLSHEAESEEVEQQTQSSGQQAGHAQILDNLNCTKDAVAKSKAKSSDDDMNAENHLSKGLSTETDTADSVNDVQKDDEEDTDTEKTRPPFG